MRNIILSIFVAICFNPITAEADAEKPSPKPEADLTSTPEATVEQFVKALQQNDLPQALKACAIDEMARNFEYDRYAEYLQAMIFHKTMVPPHSKFSIDINRYTQIARLVEQIRYLMYSLLTDEEDLFRVVSPYQPERLENYIAALDPKRLRSLTIIAIGAPRAPDNERHLRRMRIRAQVYRAQDITERVALLSFGTEFYALGVTLLRYDKTWKINDLSSALANLPPLGLEKTTLEKFLHLVQGDGVRQ